MYYIRTLRVGPIQHALTAMVIAALLVAPRAVSTQERSATDTGWVGDALRTAGLEPQAAGLARATETFEAHREHYRSDGPSPVDVRVVVPAGSEALAARLMEAATTALDVYEGWIGPFPHSVLTLLDAPWGIALAGVSHPGLIIVDTPWLSPPSDLALERAVVGGMARQYFPVPPALDDAMGWFREGLVLYLGNRAIHETLQGRHHWTGRFFGGFVPHTTRALLLSPSTFDPSPRVRSFTDTDIPDPASWRAALALHTLERYLGWPAFQQALAAFHDRHGSGHFLPADFAAVIAEQRGTDLSWFLAEAFRLGVTFDYGIDGFTSERRAGSPPTYDTRLTLKRYGDAVFRGGSAASDDGRSRVRSLPVQVSFADGTEVEEWWDGRVEEAHFGYVSTAPAVAAYVDPGVMLLLDADRTNNTRTLQSRLRPTGVRLALHWVVWLQDLLLTYTALT